MAKTKPSRVPIGDWPLLTRFYGIGPTELAHLPPWLTRLYAEKLPEIEAQEALRNSTISMIPHVEKSDRDRIIRGLVQQAGAEPTSDAKPVDPTTKEGVAALAGMGIGVHIDSKENNA